VSSEPIRLLIACQPFSSGLNSLVICHSLSVVNSPNRVSGRNEAQRLLAPDGAVPEAAFVYLSAVGSGRRHESLGTESRTVRTPAVSVPAMRQHGGCTVAGCAGQGFDSDLCRSCGHFEKRPL
jgi:hypothetical protein